ncbi:MAG: polysaccharide biosynthesis protein [Saprospiraceae bacterium]|nr:MAG: polysaccharide biosynthesis protein [Saprospiraceae bacterium]
MSLIKSLAKETAVYGVSNILNRLLNYIIVTPYLTRVFDNDQGEYGIHGLMYAFSALLLVMLTYGMETAFFRFGHRTEDRPNAFSTACISLLASTLGFVVLLLLFSSDIAAMLTSADDGIYVIYFTFIIAFDVLVAIPFARLRLENRPILFAFLKVINILVNAGMLLFFLELCPVLISHDYGAIEAIYDPSRKLDYVFIANLIASAVTLMLLLPTYFRIKLRFDWVLWKRMFRYAFPLIIVGITGMFSQLADRYLLKEWLPGSLDENLIQLGIYNACIKIAVLMNLFTQAFKFAAEPFFFRHADREDSRLIYARVGQAFALVGSLAMLGILLYLDLVQYLIAPSFRGGLNIVPLLLLAYLFLGIYYSFSIWYKLTDQTKFGAYISTAGAILVLVLNYLLIPRIGYMGSAWASLACFAFMTVVSYLVGQRYYPVPYPIGKMIFYILSALGVYGLSLWLRPDVLWQILLVNTGLMVGYLGIVVWMERKAFKAILGGKQV